jgi:hypothetical protein
MTTLSFGVYKVLLICPMSMPPILLHKKIIKTEKQRLREVRQQASAGLTQSDSSLYLKIDFLQNVRLKGIDRSFVCGGGGECSIHHSIRTDKLEAWLTFLSHFEEPSPQDQQKTH